MYRINRITQEDYEKYRNRSVMAISGLTGLLQHADDIANMDRIRMKYLSIAQAIGLVMENPNSAYNFFIPLNAPIVFLLRMSNHNNTNANLYNMHEKLGRPNKRYILFFKRGNDFNDNSSTFLDAEHHTVPFNIDALDNETSVSAFINSLIKLFENGDTMFPSLPITNNSDKQEEQIMRQNKVRLTESKLRQIVRESIKQVLKEAAYKEAPLFNDEGEVIDTGIFRVKDC